LALMMIGNDEAFAMKAGKRSGPWLDLYW
jgi:hypothetical protein